MNTVLHIGLYKTGSTAIQLWLRDHHDLLADHGIRFPYGWLRRDNHLELALALLNTTQLTPARTRGDEWRDPDWRAWLARSVMDDLRRHPDEITVLSGEDTALLRSGPELANLRLMVGDAHVVVYLREPTSFLAAWEHTLTHKLNLPTSDDPDAFNCVGPDSWQVDYDRRIEAWRAHFSQVTVLDYETVRDRDGSVIPSFASLLGIEREEYGPLEAYWLNGREDAYEHREPGLRWTGGGCFGARD